MSNRADQARADMEQMEGMVEPAEVRCAGLERTITKQRAHIAKLQRRLAKCGSFEALEAELPKGPEQRWSVTCYAPGEYAAWASVPIDGNPKTFDAGGPTPSAAVAACLARVKEAGR